MKTEYRNAMNKIKADDEFKARLLNKLAQEQKKIDTRKPVIKSAKLPIIASLSSAAVLALLIYSSTVLILPIFKNSIYDMSNASPGIDYQIHYGDKQVTPDDNAQNNITDTPSQDGNDSQQSQLDKSFDQSNDNSNTQIPSQNNGEVQTDRQTDDQQTEKSVPQNGYRIVSYSAIDSNMFASGTEDLIEYDSILHFNFEGFDKYGIGLMKNDIVFEAALSRDYTLADLFCDYYNIIIGRNATTSVTNGMLDSFLYVYANSKRQIHVFIDGVEIVNLDNVRLSEFSGMSDVYFTVSVT